jgi:hypothetical protein
MEQKTITDHELRDDVNARLDRPMSNSEWGALIRTGEVRRFREQHANPEALAEAIRQFRRDFGGAASKPEQRGLLPKGKRSYGGLRDSDRVLAISDFISQQARMREDVKQYRESVLRGQLIEPDDVEPWITRQASADGPPTLFVSLPLPKGNQLVTNPQGDLVTKKAIDTTKKDAIVSTSRIFLEYGTPGGGFIQFQPVSMTGVLNRLRMLSENLASDYRWQKSQASTFVLTDLAPILPSFSSSVHHGLLPVADRVTLEVDPSVSPRELAALYRKAIQRIYGRDRERVTDKHMRLAAFATSRPAGQTLAESMKVWNRHNPDLKYEYNTNFGRDLKDALRKTRLTEEPGTHRLRRSFEELRKSNAADGGK